MFVLILLGPIALKWNSDETLPMNCDVDLTTDILIYDSCGKKVSLQRLCLRRLRRFRERIGSIHVFR